MSTTGNITFGYLRLWCSPQIFSDDINFNSVEELEISNETGSREIINLKTFASNTFTNKIQINTSCGLSNLEYFGKNRSITNITFDNVNLSNTSWLSEMTQVTNLKLSRNNINDISSFSNLTKLEKINLNTNNITNLTPLVQAIGDDNKINYTELDIRYNSLDGYTVADNISALLKLHAAGLQKVYITGNNFSENEIQELINGKTIDGVSYSGFGSGNVIN